MAAESIALLGANLIGSTLSRFIPEPKTRASTSFSSVLGGVGGALGQAAGAVTGIDPSYVDLLNKQVEIQTQMQLVNFHSNIEKSKHETLMAPVRNIRVG